MIDKHWDEKENKPHEIDTDDLDDADILAFVEGYLSKHKGMREADECHNEKDIKREYCMQSAAFLLSLYSRHGINIENYA